MFKTYQKHHLLHPNLKSLLLRNYSKTHNKIAKKLHLGVPGGSPGGALGVPGESHGGPGSLLGVLGMYLGTMVAPRLASWPYLGPTWSQLGTNLGPTWGQLGSTWGHLGANLVPNELQLGQNDLQICARYTVMNFMLIFVDFSLFFDTKNNWFLLLFCSDFELTQQVKIIKKHSKHFGFWRFSYVWLFSI